MTTELRAVVVTGSRHWARPTVIWDALDTVQPDLVIEGCAPGADRAARDWASDRGVAVLSWPDDHWGGTVSGPTRNGYMVRVAAALKDAGWSVRVHAFPENDSRGTWSCVNQAKKAGLDISVWAEVPRDREAI